jgi:hypothetical protein
MTPEELGILFSSYVAVFILISLTNRAEQIENPAYDAARQAEHDNDDKDEDEEVTSELAMGGAWNVAGFFGLKERLNKKRIL